MTLREILEELTGQATSEFITYDEDDIKKAIKQIQSLIPSEEELQEIILNNCLKIRKQQTIFNVEQTAKAIHDDLQNRLNKKGD